MSRTGRFSELRHYDVDPQSAALLPLEECLEGLFVVLGTPTGDPTATVTVGAVEPNDPDLRAALEERLERRVALVQLNAYEVRKALARQHGLPSGDRGIATKLAGAREIRFGPDLAASDMVDDLLSVAVRVGATDVHIELFQDDVDLRFRMDGFLRQVTTPLSPANVGPVIARLKVLAELDSLERRRPQDGHFSALYEGEDPSRPRRVDLRVSTVPGVHGEDVALRILDPDTFRLELDELGMPPATLAGYRQAIHAPSGLVVVAGPTLSGKTNTLYASIQALRAGEVKVVTVEDPIEYDFPKVNQKTVNADLGFADYLRAFLRQNPDVMMVGEVRDEETADTVAQAATTGHLVLTTVHTRGAISTIGRLRVLGIPDETLAEILVATLGQRLVPRLCAACRHEAAPPDELIQRFFGEAPAQRFFAPGGCEACAETGFRGLVAVFELLEHSRNLRRAIAAGAPLEQLYDLALAAPGFSPLLEGALGLVAAGETTLEQVARKILPPYPGYVPSA